MLLLAFLLPGLFCLFVEDHFSDKQQVWANPLNKTNMSSLNVPSADQETIFRRADPHSRNPKPWHCGVLPRLTSSGLAGDRQSWSEGFYHDNILFWMKP